MNGYSVFAQYYDLLTQNVGYRQRAEYFDRIIKLHGKEPGLLLDLACGTGSLSVELAALGYEVIGADASGEMLSVAMQKALTLQKQILFLRQPMQKLDLYGTVAVCVCALDSLNHLEDETAFAQTFEKLSLFIEPGGLLLFDLNSAYKHRQVLADNAFIYDLPEIYCVWQNSYHKENDRIEIALDFFQQQESGAYIRMQERFNERIFSENFVKHILDKTGFALESVYGDDTLEAPAPHTQRLVYVAKRRED